VTDVTPLTPIETGVGFPLGDYDPTQLGPYTLLRKLGEGGMGVVYLACTETGRQVAIKAVRSAYAWQSEFRRRFRQEATNARRVARFCTAEVLDADPDADPPYLVTEYIEGSTLANVVGSDGPLSGANLERLAVGVAAALTAIHGAGIVHRDLKPMNVMISPSGPRVIDFGIASAMEATTEISQGLRTGTPAFMAPEQVRGDEVTTAADVFAWGGVVAFAGTGRNPFGTGPTEGVLYRVVREEPRLDGLDPALRPLVEQAMNKNPELRPSATELLMCLLGGSGATDPHDVVTRVIGGWEAGSPVVARPTPAEASDPGLPASGPPAPDLAGLAGLEVVDPPSARVPGSQADPARNRSPGRRRPGRWLPVPRTAVVAAVAVAVTALASVAVQTVIGGGHATAGEVELGRISDAGRNPFMSPIGADVPTRTSPPAPTKALAGNTPGLYGGIRERSVCDAGKMVAFLRTHPPQAAAWAGVLGISPQQIPSYAAGLTSVILRADTAVTNHGFLDGHATTIPAVLEAGTAVLVDQQGTPVAKCYCGNPLTKPTLYTRPTYVGTSWPAFSPARVATVRRTATPIRQFTLVDVTTDKAFIRPSETTGQQDLLYTPPVVTGPDTSSPDTWLPESLSSPSPSINPSGSPPSDGTPTAGTPTVGTLSDATPTDGTPSSAPPSSAPPSTAPPSSAPPTSTPPSAGTPTTVPPTDSPTSAPPTATPPATGTTASAPPAAGTTSSAPTAAGPSIAPPSGGSSAGTPSLQPVPAASAASPA
jgi:Protein kinase domain